MDHLAVLPYIETERQITGQGQKMVVHNHRLYLYKTQISAFSQVFALNEVYDMSFRKMGGDEGIFYLHTKQGVYPYRINIDPAFFIHAYKQISRV